MRLLIGIPMKKRFLLTVLSIVSLMTLGAQDYQNAAGLRLGLSSGLTLKHFISTTDAVEGILTTRWGGFSVTGLFERHKGAFNTDGLYFYYGGGAHIASYNNLWFADNLNHTLLGIDGIAGFEYIIEEIPINVSLDWKPYLNLIGHTGFLGDELALSVRYMF